MVLLSEIQSYGEILSGLPLVFVASKVEDQESEERAEAWFSELQVEGICISSVTGKGLNQLLNRLVEEMQEASRRNEGA